MKKLLLLLSASFILSSCDKENHTEPGDTTYDCQSLKQGIINMNPEQVRQQVNTLCSGLMPNVTASDQYGHAQNLDLLAQRLSGKCEITATVICYTCIFTDPPQSEIRLTFNQNGVSYTGVLDIRTDPEQPLYCYDIHE